MHAASSGDLCGCLRKIAGLLEKGDPVEAATVVADMNELLPRLPSEMPAEQVSEARLLLLHCEELERGLRKIALASLQRLGATRRSMAYRRYSCGP